MIYAENILLCITVPMLLSLLFVRGSARRFVMASIGGMIACLLAAYISGYLYLITGLTRTDVSIFLSPMVEETLKFIPPIFILLIMSPTDRNLLLIAVGIGVGFATFENCCYLLSEGASSLTLILIRGLAVGVMHTISMATLSMALSAARRLEALTAPAIFGALSLSVVFHGLYNLLVSEPGVTSYIGYLLPLVSAGLLYLPFHILKLDAEEKQSE